MYPQTYVKIFQKELILMAELTYGRGYVYSIQYHIVWCVKYRRKVIQNDIRTRLFELLEKIAEDNRFQIICMETDLDHIHLLINCTPQHYIPNVIKAMKGVTARLLLKEFGNSLRNQLYKGHLWNPSYFIATVSEQTESQIHQYIMNQQVK